MIIVLPLSRSLRNELINIQEEDGDKALDYVMTSFLKKVILKNTISIFTSPSTGYDGDRKPYSKLIVRMVVQYRSCFTKTKFRRVRLEDYTVSRGTLKFVCRGD